MKKNNLPAILLLLWLAVSACASPRPAEAVSLPIPSAAPPNTEAQVLRISVQEAKRALDAGQAVLVDVRSLRFYAAAHAKSAISLPLEKMENELDHLSLDHDQWIITYCA